MKEIIKYIKSIPSTCPKRESNEYDAGMEYMKMTIICYLEEQIKTINDTI
jgi:hypothetical protein